MSKGLGSDPGRLILIALLKNLSAKNVRMLIIIEIPFTSKSFFLNFSYYLKN